MAYCVKLSGEDSSRYSNKIESEVQENVRIITMLLTGCPTSLRENSWHRYGMKKLRHCHPMYKPDGCIMWNAHNTVFDSKRSAICAVGVYFLHSTRPSVT